MYVTIYTQEFSFIICCISYVCSKSTEDRAYARDVHMYMESIPSPNDKAMSELVDDSRLDNPCDIVKQILII